MLEHDVASRGLFISVASPCLIIVPRRPRQACYGEFVVQQREGGTHLLIAEKGMLVVVFSEHLHVVLDQVQEWQAFGLAGIMVTGKNIWNVFCAQAIASMQQIAKERLFRILSKYPSQYPVLVQLAKERLVTVYRKLREKVPSSPLLRGLGREQEKPSAERPRARKSATAMDGGKGMRDEQERPANASGRHSMHRYQGQTRQRRSSCPIVVGRGERGGGGLQVRCAVAPKEVGETHGETNGNARLIRVREALRNIKDIVCNLEQEVRELQLGQKRQERSWELSSGGVRTRQGEVASMKTAACASD